VLTRIRLNGTQHTSPSCLLPQSAGDTHQPTSSNCPSFLMIRFFTASLFLAGVVFAHREHHTDGNPKQRKSLGFGPILPHTFQTTPHRASSFVPPNPSACPFETAQRFVDELLRGEYEYAIRDDSYTDKNTGVSHVYVRQIVNGIEVTDGDINVNVKDGVVLSWGDSVCSVCYSPCQYQRIEAVYPVLQGPSS
jgi:hypothetical protein